MVDTMKDEYVTQSVAILSDLISSLTRVYSSEYTKFGADFSNVSAEESVASTILYRLTKYWSPEGSHKILHEKAVLSTLELDHRLNSFKPVWRSDDFLTSVLLRAKGIMRKAMLNQKYDPRLGKLVFSNGSTCVSARGHNSLLEKGLNVDLWTVTAAAFTEAALLVHSTLFLKRCAAHHFKELGLQRRHNRDIPKAWLFHLDEYIAHRRNPEKVGLPYVFPYEFLGEIPRKISRAEAIFTFRLYFIVTFVEYAKFSSISKNVNENRGIEPQPFLMVCLQLSFSHTILRPVLLQMGVDLDDQGMQQVRIGHEAEGGYLTTGDLSSASECNSMWSLNNICDETVRKYVSLYRCEFLNFPSIDTIHYLSKVSSMGNGFTFELMTLILTCVCRVFDDSATVYGDDIVVTSSAWPYVQTVLEELGYIINKDKTFHNSPYRESCGKFYRDEFGYILSFKFTLPTTPLGVDICVNKLYILYNYARANYLSNKGGWIDLIETVHKILVSRVPLRRQVDAFALPNTYEGWAEIQLDRGVFSNGATEKKRKRPWPHKQNLARYCVADMFQWDVDSIEHVKLLRYDDKKSYRAANGFRHSAGSSDRVPVITGCYYLFGSGKGEVSKVRTSNKWDGNVITMGVKNCVVTGHGAYKEYSCLRYEGHVIPVGTVSRMTQSWLLDHLVNAIRLCIVLTVCEQVSALNPILGIKGRKRIKD